VRKVRGVHKVREVGMVRRFVLTGVLVGAAGLAYGQEPPSPRQMVEVDPIRCWWRTSSGAVRIGEAFNVGLTCAVLEADGVEVVPDQSQLTDSAIQMNPFEVVGGSHPPDLRSGQRRFFQYEYVVRVINPDVIGQDVPLPNLVIHYRVNSRLPGNAAMQGRDLTYLLPPQTVRVLSLVPPDAVDIRDESGASFARVESLGVRAGVMEIAAITLVALGSLMAILSLVALARGARKTKTTDERTFSEWRTLGLADAELAAVARESERQGWNDALVARALTAMRIAAASLLGRGVTQSKTAADVDTGGGRIVSRAPGVLGALLPGRRRGTAVTSAVTARDITRELDHLPLTAPVARRQQLESLGAAMTMFTAAQYGQPHDLDRAALDAALAAGSSVTRSLKTARIWSLPAARRFLSRSPAVERQA
jgi:hypothetical protein